MGKPFSEQQILDMAQMRIGGATIKDIAQHYHAHENSIQRILSGRRQYIRQILSEELLSALRQIGPTYHRTLSPQQVEQVKDLRQRGYTLGRIAQMMGVRKGTITGIIYGYSYRG